VDAMLAAAAPVALPESCADAVDIVGTGGAPSRRVHALNVSTMACFVVAGTGVKVCKHGNRKASSTSGSTDLLEELGVVVDLDGPGVAACVEDAGVGFAFARSFHPSMRHVAGVRTELGIPTVFNVLGPLSHPGRVGRQVLGVADPRLLDLVPEVLSLRGTQHAWVVHGEGGLDELTTTGTTEVVEVRAGQLRRFTVSPQDAGLARAEPGELGIGGPAENAAAARAVLAGEKGPIRDMVLLNAAAGLVVAGISTELAGGVQRAAAAVDDGTAAKVLERLVEVSQSRAARAG
jgi:anthranilate phosphoribosyltransferase